jgi:formate dehydrogenase major subunit
MGATMRDPHKLVDYSESDLTVGHQKEYAAGVKAVKISMQRALGHMGPKRSTQTLLKLNQADGFDCMSCAWPDPEVGHRHAAEFCENGAKAVAEEATTARATPELFATHSIADLDRHSEWWLGQQGRITEPMVKRPGATHYTPIDWDEAYRLIADELTALAGPDEATFYTSGRASNESAFAYQLFVRAFGTNNLPDCSNMCHESTSVGLAESIGIGKASVSIEDVYHAQLIIVAGQNPGTNHPRMLSALEVAKRNGATIVSINPLREAGLVAFKNPQRPNGVVGDGTKISDLHLPIKINGDLALFQALGSLLVQWDALDHDFINRYTTGFEGWKQHVSGIDWAMVTEVTGLSREQITELGQLLRTSTATSATWPSPRATSASPGRACSRCAGIRTSRATERWESGSGHRKTSWTRCNSSSVSIRRASTDWTPSIRSGRCAMARPMFSSVSAATSCRPRRTPRWSSRGCSGPG